MTELADMSVQGLTEEELAVARLIGMPTSPSASCRRHTRRITTSSSSTPTPLVGSSLRAPAFVRTRSAGSSSRWRTSSSTATRPTRSSTAPRSPEELAARAAELGYEALALTDHDGSTARSSSRTRRRLRRPADHRRRGHLGRAARTSRCSSRPRRATRTSAAPHDAPRRHPRARPRARAARPALDVDASRELNEGLVCLSGCARHGLAVVDPNAAAGSRSAFGRDRFYVELQRPFERGDARRNAALRDLAEALGVRTVATGDVHAHHPSRAPLQDVARRDPQPHVARGLRARAARQPRGLLASARRDAERFPGDRDAVARTAELADRLRFDLTRGARLPLPRLLRRRRTRPTRSSRRVCDRAFEERYGGANGHKRSGASAPRRRARA